MQNLNKEQALQRMDAIEKEQKELRKIIEEADKPKDITQIVTDVNSAIAYLSEQDEDVIEYRKMQGACLSNRNLAGQRITVFAKAINEKKEADWDNENEYKYIIWFDLRKKKGSGFVDCVYLYHYCSNSFSARHTYRSSKLADHASKCIEQEYYDYIKG